MSASLLEVFAAVAGIVFAVLLLTGLTMARVALADDSLQDGATGVTVVGCPLLKDQ